jgi:hypothetical protein
MSATDAVGWGRVLPEVQAAWFAAAAVWFPLTAVRRGREPSPVATAPRLPHAAAMAAMAWMTHSMAGASPEVRSRGVPEAYQAAHLAHATGESTAGDLVTGVLALYLITSALRSLTRDITADGRTADVLPAAGRRALRLRPSPSHPPFSMNSSE